jgi:hypothetical protein
VVDVVRGERVEKELDAMIERRNRQRRKAEGGRRIEEAWAELERRYNARRSEEVRAARVVEYHRSQAVSLRATLEALIAHHKTQAERLCETETTKGA